MLKFFIDGSAKGLVVGAGVVEVDEFGFMTTYEDHKLHPLADSNLGELFALNLAMDKVLSSNASNVLIYVDTFRVQNLFNHEVLGQKVVFNTLNPTEHISFITSIREKVNTFYAKNRQDAKLSIRNLLEDSYEFNVFTNTAHSLSRCYFKHYDAIYLDENTPLKKNDSRTKLEINHATKAIQKSEHIIPEVVKPNIVNVKIERTDSQWISEVDSSETKPYVNSKHLVNVFLHTYNNLCKELDVQSIKLSISSSSNIVANIKKSVEYVNCPEDIKNKGLWVLTMVESGQFIIA